MNPEALGVPAWRMQPSAPLNAPRITGARDRQRDSAARPLPRDEPRGVQEFEEDRHLDSKVRQGGREPQGSNRPEEKDDVGILTACATTGTPTFRAFSSLGSYVARSGSVACSRTPGDANVNHPQKIDKQETPKQDCSWRQVAVSPVQPAPWHSPENVVGPAAGAASPEKNRRVSFVSRSLFVVLWFGSMSASSSERVMRVRWAARL